MSNFGNTVTMKGRKNHRCIACYGGIPKGEEHVHFKGMWGGDWQDWRMHKDCHENMDADDLDDGFIPGSFERPLSAIFAPSDPTRSL